MLDVGTSRSSTTSHLGRRRAGSTKVLPTPACEFDEFADVVSKCSSAEPGEEVGEAATSDMGIVDICLKNVLAQSAGLLSG